MLWQLVESIAAAVCNFCTFSEILPFMVCQSDTLSRSNSLGSRKSRRPRDLQLAGQTASGTTPGVSDTAIENVRSFYRDDTNIVTLNFSLVPFFCK